MAKKTSPPTRIDPDFFKDMKKMALVRANKGLAKISPRDMSMTEMTRLFRRTEGYKMGLEELSWKPKRRCK